MKILFLAIFVSAIFFVSCENNSEGVVHVDGALTSTSIATHYDSIITEIDQIETLHKKNIETIVNHEAYSDTLVLQLLQINGYARKLCYTIFGEDGVNEGHAAYYFGDSGNLIGHKVKIDETSFCQIFHNKDSVIVYQKNEKIKINVIDTSAIYSKLAIASCEIASYMAFFPRIIYCNVNAPTRSTPILRTFKETHFRSTPSKYSDKIAEIQNNTHLVYLSSTNRLDTIDGKVWVWFNVVSEKYGNGWIFGYPKDVGLLTDENW